MSAPKHILIAANPKSGAVSRDQLLAELRGGLQNDGFEVDLCTDLNRVETRAAELHAAGRLQCVVSAGGDGTAAVLANRITAEIPLLVFPLGTENLLAKHLQLTSSIAEARARVQAARTIALDVGLANGKMFLVMASCGFDAAVVEAMHASRKGHINRWSYTWPILRALRSYRFPMVRLRETDASDKATREQSAAWTFVFNLPRYAANLQFCPQACAVDGKLDVCTFRQPGMWRGFGYLSRLWLGSHQRLSDFSHSTVTNLSIDCCDDSQNATSASSSVSIPYQLDGDPGGVLPLEISVLPAV